MIARPDMERPQATVDVERLQRPREDGDAVSGGDRQQRSQPQSSVVPVVVVAEYSRAHGILRRP